MCGSTNPRLRIVVGWMVGRGWMVGWVVSTCVTTRHHTTLGGERLLSLVWFWLFVVWVVGWMVGRGWMVGWVVITCVTTWHQTTLGGERLLSLVWFWLFGVWVVGCMVGRVVGTCIRQGALMANPGGDVLVYIKFYICVCVYS